MMAEYVILTVQDTDPKADDYLPKIMENKQPWIVRKGEPSKTPRKVLFYVRGTGKVQGQADVQRVVSNKPHLLLTEITSDIGLLNDDYEDVTVMYDSFQYWAYMCQQNKPVDRAVGFRIDEPRMFKRPVKIDRFLPYGMRCMVPIMYYDGKLPRGVL